MGYMFCMGPCVGCKNVFSFNPERVPSVLWNGTLEPICPVCVERANRQRTENGLDPIVPLPGAYDAEEV